MKQRLKFNQTLLLAALGTVVLLIGLGITLLSPSAPKQTTTPTVTDTTDSATNNEESRRVFIQGLFQHKDDIDPETQRAVESQMYIYASQGKPDLYTGTIRPGSYSKVTPPGSLSTVELLVDVQPVNQTYKVHIEDSQQTDYRAVYITCAPTDQQIARSTTCKDGVSHE